MIGAFQKATICDSRNIFEPYWQSSRAIFMRIPVGSKYVINTIKTFYKVHEVTKWNGQEQSSCQKLKQSNWLPHATHQQCQ